MNAADVLCYTYEADYHCTPCAIKRFGEQPGSPILHPWIADDSIDSDGNTPAPVFGDSEWWNREESMPQNLHCSDCNEVIDTAGEDYAVGYLLVPESVHWQPCFYPLVRYLKANPTEEGLPWQYMGTDDAGNFHYRERKHNNRIKVNKNGRLAAIHSITYL